MQAIQNDMKAAIKIINIKNTSKKINKYVAYNVANSKLKLKKPRKMY